MKYERQEMVDIRVKSCNVTAISRGVFGHAESCSEQTGTYGGQT
jgi:hypothetical protein